jgi:hypothetical protein
MLRACVAVGLLAAFGPTAFSFLGRDVARAAGDAGCADPDTSYTTDSLYDVRSFSDAVAVVRAVKEEVPPEPEGPEGGAGLIGRKVTFRVERVLWRRPHGPKPPKTARFSDLGWVGELDDRRPLRMCGETRMELGRRYLAPIVRHHGTWYPFFDVRMRLRGDLVIGGVDAGEPTHAHHALMGQRVSTAVETIARTQPYRAVALNPRGSPARRWQRVDRDHYRVWRKRFPSVVVASGVTEKSRWEMHARVTRRGELCAGVDVRRLWRSVLAPDGEACWGRAGSERLFFGETWTLHRGRFAYGGAGASVWAVRVRFGEGEWQRVDTLPTQPQLHVRQRFWVVPSDNRCGVTHVQALGEGDRVLEDLPFEPAEPYAAC